MATVERFEDLDVWHRARGLTNLIYDLAQQGSFAKDFALKDQMRRAAISIMSNVAEGFESRTQALFIDFLGRAKGSCGELRSQLFIALDRRYLSKEEFSKALGMAERCSRQIASLMRYLESRPNSRRIRDESITYEL